MAKKTKVEKTGVVCPHCGEKDTLTVAQEEHTDYVVNSITNGNIELNLNTSDCYDATFIHVHCNACDTYWYSEGEFKDDVKKSKFYETVAK